MALHYNLKECNLEGVPDNIVTEMIYCTMVIEIGHFTEKNIKEVFYRISIAEMLNGCPFHYEPKTFKSILANMDLLKNQGVPGAMPQGEPEGAAPAQQPSPEQLMEVLNNVRTRTEQ